MIKNYVKLLLMVALFSSANLFAQDYITAIQNNVAANRSTLGISDQDVQDLKISDEVLTRRTGITHVYASQQFQGTPIYNAFANAAFRNGEIVFLSTTLENDIASRVNATSPVLNPLQGASSAASGLNLGNATFSIVQTLSSKEFILNTGGVSVDNVPVKLVYVPMEDGSLKLAWDLSIHYLDGTHWYSVRVDANSGEILDKNDWIVSCNFGEHKHNTSFSSNTKKESANTFKVKAQEPSMAMAGEQYNVYALPFESPLNGDATIVFEPQNLTASPFGWHDIDGVDGAEFTITRGNNVYAYEDRAAADTPGISPDGGETLTFDFPYIFDTNPVNMSDATTTNLFYWNNIMHDVFYQYGFDEASGSFQETNYTGEGLGSDSVVAEAQDGEGLNNANFGTPPDGQNPRMQMFLWSASGPPSESLTVNTGSLAGSYIAVPASFGEAIPEDTALSGDLVVVIDDNLGGESTDEIDACDDITNAAEIAGNIAVIRRGVCEFGSKVLRAENAGAIAVIMINNIADDPISMGPGAEGGSVTIPSVMVSQADGEALLAALEAGEMINVSLQNMGPYQIDGDLDNGIIAHEYGHGISNRLTGGPTVAGCLSNDEQMGEGWSDYFGLMLTMTEFDTAEQGRGIGNYAIGATYRWTWDTTSTLQYRPCT